MNDITIFNLSTQFLATEIQWQLPNDGIADLSMSPVYFAFLSGENIPDSGTTWIAGQWAQDTINIAQILVGPSGRNLSIGSYTVWVKVSLSPQEPVIRIGTINVY